jgi:ligand-binding sensor domain-containing protein/anti-sigma regulatory factor (Ser/Thr protein kinase)
MRHLKCTIILLFAWQFCLAQDFNTYFHHLTVENGLSEATNDYVYQDSRGFVWIGSVSGLNRFDGRQIRVYQPESADPMSLFGQNVQGSFFEDDNTDIWFSTYEGINQYVRKTDSFKHYTLIDSTTQQPLAGYYVAYLDDKGLLWMLVNEQSIYLFDTKTHQFIKKNTVVGNAQRLRIQSNEQKKVVRTFAYSWNSGSLGMQMTEYLADGKLKQETLFDKKSLNPLSIFDLFAKNEQIWITTNKGLYHFDIQSKNLRNYNLDAIVIAVQPFSKKELLVTTRGKGALIVDKSNGEIVKQFTHSIDNRHSLAANNLVNNYINENKNIWIQIDGQGVDFMNFDKTKFKVIYHYPTTKNLLKPFNTLFSNVDKAGFLWSNTLDKTLRQFDKNGLLKDSFVVNTPSARGLKATNIFLSFTDKQSRLWFQSFNTLQYFDAKTLSFKDLPKNDLLFLYSLVTQSGRILVATFSGVYELVETSTKKFEFKPISQIPNSKPHAILFEDNDTWIWGSYDAISLRIYNPTKNYELVKELPINGVITGFWHQPNSPFVWICSQNGLYKIDKNTWQFANFTETSGLPSRTINTMQVDTANNLWLGTSKGLAKFDIAKGMAHAYNLVDGISDLNFNMYASTQAADGTMYFGTSNGITSFHPQKVIPLSIQARPTITNILVNDGQQKGLICRLTGATNTPEIQSLQLPFSQNTLSFTFAAMEYSDPTSCQFKYKMEGLDKDWVDAGTQNFVRYPNIQAGTYSFYVKASNSDGVWNDTPKALVIRIIPPFYKTWWFITLCLLATMSLVGYIVFLRLSKVIALQKIRLNLYENLHDDIGSRLTAIVLTIDELRQKATTKDLKLERIGTISRNIVANMRRLVWATAPENDALSTVAQQMQTDKRVLLPTGVTFHLRVDKTLENLNIGGDKRYQMLSIFNEALTNIAKYAEAKNVETRIEIQDKNLIMTIVDDGKGFDPLQKREDTQMSSGHGLRNMQRRANRIKGQLDIVSKLGEGTSVKLIFPMHDDTFWMKLKVFFSKYHQK